jgi:hypothetical protein
MGQFTQLGQMDTKPVVPIMFTDLLRQRTTSHAMVITNVLKRAEEFYVTFTDGYQLVIEHQSGSPNATISLMKPTRS